MKDIGLFDLIEQIKRELLTPRPDDLPLFAIGSVELELSFTVTHTVDGGIDLKVVTLGTDKGTEQIQRIKVTLEPLMTAEQLLHDLPPEILPRLREKLIRGEVEE